MRVAALFALLLTFASVAVGAAERTPFTIGYLEIAADPRYAETPSYTGLKLKSRKRPLAGAEAALGESRVIGRALGLDIRLANRTAATPDALAATARALRDEAAVRFFIVDANADALLALADAVRGDGIVLFNITETADRLRRQDCRPNLMHVIPSQAMLTDAMAQYLAFKNWRRALLLRGQMPADLMLAAAFERSARKFGLKLAAVRDFVLSNDPRERGENNIRLLTAEPDHDVVYLADSDGEFGRYVPFQTQKPRPVVGTEGLIASAWHWAWERHGAPQANQRFERSAGREMQDGDWAAWAAYRLVVEALSRTRSTEFGVLAAYLKGDALRFDAYKGNPASFRSWNNQLRQPILLHTHNAVVGRAPLDGFLHRTNVLDTLGIDEPENACRF